MFTEHCLCDPAGLENGRVDKMLSSLTTLQSVIIYVCIYVYNNTHILCVCVVYFLENTLWQIGQACGRENGGKAQCRMEQSSLLSLKEHCVNCSVAFLSHRLELHSNMSQNTLSLYPFTHLVPHSL